MKPFVGQITVYLLVFLSTGAITGIFTGQEAMHTGTTAAAHNPALQVTYSVIYLLLVLLLVSERREILSLLLREKWMTILVLFALASTLWSVEPGDTFRRSIGLLGTTLAGLYIGTHFEPRQQIRILAVCIVVAAVLSLFVGIAFPPIGVTTDGWQGVFFQKNSLGRMMCLGIVCLSFIAAGDRRNRLFSLLVIPLCITLLLLSESVTAAFVAFGLLISIPFIPILRWPIGRLAAIGVAFAAVIIPLGVWVLENSDVVLRALGKQSHLTGRLPLWAHIKAEILTMPILGHGYAAFWSTPESDRLRQTLNWDVMNAHNGFLEMMLGLGIVGLVIFLFGLFRNFLLAFLVARESDEIEQAWPLFFLGFCILWELTDSTLFTGNSVFWLLYAANAFWLVEARAKVNSEASQGFAVSNHAEELLLS